MLNDFLLELKAYPQWVGFRKIWKQERNKFVKPLINPRNGKYADTSDASTWATYDEVMNWAISDAQRQGLSVGDMNGLGFVFTDTDCYAGIDMDDVISDNGELADWAADVVRIMDSYTEYSPSRRGLHILFTLNVPYSEIGSRHREDARGIEAYYSRQYFTITGNVYGEGKPISERTEAFRTVYAKYFPVEEKESATMTQIRSSNLNKPDTQQAVTTNPSPVVNPSDELSDSELWERMFASTNGHKIRALFNGDYSAYTHTDGTPDHSAADMSLCCYLAYWTRHDASRIDRMFRKSGMYRDKWERIAYREKTIAEAIRLTPLFNPSVYQLTNWDGVSLTYKHADAGREDWKYKPDTTSATNAEERNSRSMTNTLNIHSALSYLDNSFQSDVNTFSSYSEIKTGYCNLDEENSLYPGLYCLGAVTSIGKTTFALQMAHAIAKAGEHVLYFACEQSEFELTSKELSRLTAVWCDKTQVIPDINATTALNIRKNNPRNRDALDWAIQKYRTYAGNISIIECGFQATAEIIASTVKQYAQDKDFKPVVFVDYLQCLKPEDKNTDTITALDLAVQCLKNLSLDLTIPVIVISSFNRENYLSIVDFTSFKGSGGLEYTSDVVWAMQLLGMNAEIFSKQAELWKKRKFAMRCKGEIPRHIELIALKNRYGKASERFFFTYDPRFDSFTPDTRDFNAIEEQLQAEYMKFNHEIEQEKDDNSKRGQNKPRNSKGEF